MSSGPAGGGASDRIEPWVWRIAGIVIVGAIMSILDTTIVNVALNRLGRELQLAVVPSFVLLRAEREARRKPVSPLAEAPAVEPVGA